MMRRSSRHTIAEQNGGGIGKIEWRVNGVTLGVESRGLERLAGGYGVIAGRVASGGDGEANVVAGARREPDRGRRLQRTGPDRLRPGAGDPEVGRREERDPAKAARAGGRGERLLRQPPEAVLCGAGRARRWATR